MALDGGLPEAGAAPLDPALAYELLAWQLDMGVYDALDEAPIDRFAQSATEEAARIEARQAQAAQSPAAAREQGERGARRAAVVSVSLERDFNAEAEELARGAQDLEALAEAMASFEGCALKRGARNFLFADGVAKARVMVIAEPPTREEDAEGQLYLGREGALFDAMFAAIGLSRSTPDAQAGLYLAPALPWRLVDPMSAAANLALMAPFLRRHVALADPDVVILMGNGPCQALLGQEGITRLRGRWQELDGRPVMPMLPPQFLLRQAQMKRPTWADLLELKARLGGKK